MGGAETDGGLEYPAADCDPEEVRGGAGPPDGSSGPSSRRVRAARRRRPTKTSPDRSPFGRPDSRAKCGAREIVPTIGRTDRASTSAASIRGSPARCFFSWARSLGEGCGQHPRGWSAGRSATAEATARLNIRTLKMDGEGGCWSSPGVASVRLQVASTQDLGVRRERERRGSEVRRTRSQVQHTVSQHPFDCCCCFAHRLQPPSRTAGPPRRLACCGHDCT